MIVFWIWLIGTALAAVPFARVAVRVFADVADDPMDNIDYALAAASALLTAAVWPLALPVGLLVLIVREDGTNR